MRTLKHEIILIVIAILFVIWSIHSTGFDKNKYKVDVDKTNQTSNWKKCGMDY